MPVGGVGRLLTNRPVSKTGLNTEAIAPAVLGSSAISKASTAKGRLECVTEVPTGLCPVGDVRVSSHTEHSCGASTIQMRRVPFRTRTSTTSNNSAVLIRRLCCRKDVFVRWRCRCARHAHKQKLFHCSDCERLHLALSPARNWICSSVTACLHGARLVGLFVTPTASQWPTKST